MFIKIGGVIVNINNIKCFYTDKIDSNLYVIQADDFDGYSHCIYSTQNEEKAVEAFQKIVEKFEKRGVLIKVGLKKPIKVKY